MLSVAVLGLGRVAYPEMRRRNVKNDMVYLGLSDVFFQALNVQKLVFGWGSAPDPAGGAYDAPPDPLVGWGCHTLPPRCLWQLESQSRRLGCQAPQH